MGPRQSGMFSTADAVLRTETRCDSRYAAEVVCRTAVTYEWNEALQWGRARKCDRREMPPVECVMRVGDRSAVREAWDVLFDYVVQIQMNSPVSMRWELDLGGLRRGNAWLLGAVQTLSEVVAWECGLKVEVTGRAHDGS